MNILETIIAQKQKEVDEKKAILSVDFLKFMFTDFDRECNSLKHALNSGNDYGIIAEFKRKSPSKGWINKDIFIVDVIPYYQMNGATGISVLTDKKFFGGEIEELFTTKTIIEIPLLRKDFIIDEFQLYESKGYGADVILLIAACLSKQQIKELAKKAKELQLEVLLEIHSKQEIEWICDEVDIIGINNRNLETFKTDINTSIDLIKYLPSDKPIISESGINDIEIILELRAVGFKGFLIGEYFMKQTKPAVAFADFMKRLKAKLK